MKKRRKLISMLALAVMLAWSLPLTVQASSPSVNDCLENKTECDELEGTETPNTNPEQPVDQPASNQINNDSTSLVMNMVKLIAALAVVLALIYLLLKLVNRKNKLFQKHPTLENLGGITLGTQKSMQVVRIGQRFYIVGVGDNVELLTELTDEKTIHALVNKDENMEFNPANLVTSMLGKKRSSQKNAEDSHAKEDFSAHFKSELDRVKSNRKQSFSRYLDKGDKENE